MVKRVYDIVLLFKEYVLLALYLLLAIALLALNDTPQIRTIRSLTLAVTGTLQSALSVLPNYFGLYDQNRILRELNLTLSDEVSRLREAKLENIRLRRMLGLKDRAPLQYIAANVVGVQNQPLRNSITIDVGARDSVRTDMPVVTDQGLVGKVVAVSGAHAIVQLLLHKDMRVSAKDQRSRVDGIIRWEGGAYLSLSNVAKSLDVQVGDAVVTSEYSSLFPRGVRIGVVASVSQPFGHLFHTIEVAPAVDFARLEEVFVVVHSVDSTLAGLERQTAR
jgi:rod shape-determining protein MreC